MSTFPLAIVFAVVAPCVALGLAASALTRVQVELGRRPGLDVCEATWSIPGKGNAESLNAAIAGAIVTSELSRRLSALGL